MKKKPPWTALRISIAILGIASLITTVYGIWLVNTNQDVGGLGAVLVFFLGDMLLRVAGALTAMFALLYILIVRNLSKSANVAKPDLPTPKQ